MSKWSEICTILVHVVAQSSNFIICYFHHLFPCLYAPLTDGLLYFRYCSLIVYRQLPDISLDSFSFVFTWAYPCGRIRGLRIDSAFPSVCYFNIHTANNELAHLTVVEFTDFRNFQNSNFHVWYVEWKIRTEGNTNIWSLSVKQLNRLVLLGQWG